MTSQIQVIPDGNKALRRQPNVENRVKDMTKGTKGWVETEDYPCPGFDVFPESPEQADEIIAEIEANYPEFVMLYD